MDTVQNMSSRIANLNAHCFCCRMKILTRAFAIIDIILTSASLVIGGTFYSQVVPDWQNNCLLVGIISLVLLVYHVVHLVSLHKEHLFLLMIWCYMQTVIGVFYGLGIIYLIYYEIKGEIYEKPLELIIVLSCIMYAQIRIFVTYLTISDIEDRKRQEGTQLIFKDDV